MKNIKIGIIGDFDGRPSHIATEESIKHSAKLLAMKVDYEWLPTPLLEKEADSGLQQFNGLWCSPGSPYKSMNGALNAIQFAREHNVPFIGTCGGFQHAVIEFGRNVLKLEELQNADFDFYSPNPYITPLECSLLGQSKSIHILPHTMIASLYKQQSVMEKYNCSFGLDRHFEKELTDNGFILCGKDETGGARILMLKDASYFVITLFQPQLSSTYEQPHCLVTEFIHKAMENM